MARVGCRHLGKSELSDKYGQTPLHSAAGRGFEGRVKVRLGRDGASPINYVTSGERPPIELLGSWDGREAVVKTLLGRDNVGPEKSDGYCQTPLHIAGC